MIFLRGWSEPWNVHHQVVWILMIHIPPLYIDDKYYPLIGDVNIQPLVRWDSSKLQKHCPINTGNICANRQKPEIYEEPIMPPHSWFIIRDSHADTYVWILQLVSHLKYQNIDIYQPTQK